MMCDLNKPLFSCTLGDFAEAVVMVLAKQANDNKAKQIGSDGACVKGIHGIMDIFNCKEFTARKILHSGVIDDAVTHLGERSFIVNVAKAKDLVTINQNKLI